MYWIDFNGQRNRTFGIEVVSRPSIPAPEIRGEYVSVAGKDGSLLITDGAYENIAINVPMNVVNRPYWLGDSYRRAKAWLRGSGPLRLFDDPSVYYRVKHAGVLDNERFRRGQKFTASFICDPYTYLESGLHAIGAGAITNPGDLALPKYRLSGNGNVTLTVNGNSVSATVQGALTIDRDLMIAYTDDKTVVNTATSGDFLPLSLNPGINEVSVSGGSVSIIPNWRML